MTEPELRWRWYCEVHGSRCPLESAYRPEWRTGDPGRVKPIEVVGCDLAVSTVVLPFIVNGEECYGIWCGAHCGRFD